MPRRPSQTYRCRPLDELEQQLIRAPADRRLQQVFAAEALHDSLDPEEGYPFEYLAYRITGYRPEPKPEDPSRDELLIGEAVLPDLRLMIDALSRSVRIPASAKDGCALLAELAARLSVSTKTLDRWRKQGLRWRWVEPERDRPLKIGIPAGALDRFQAGHPGRVERAASFEQIPDEQRDRIVERARALAQATDTTPTALAEHLAKRTGRAKETLRLLMLKHDREHAHAPIFRDRLRPLNEHDRRAMADAHQQGIPIRALSRAYGRTRAAVDRTIQQQRIEELLHHPPPLVDHPLFERDDADDVLLPKTDELMEVPPAGPGRFIPGMQRVPERLMPLYQQPIDDDATLRALCIRMNYMNHRALRELQQLRRQPRALGLARVQDDLDRAQQIRQRIVTGVLPTTLSVINRHLVSREDPPPPRMVKLLRLGRSVIEEELTHYDAAKTPKLTSIVTNRLLRRLIDFDHAGDSIDRAAKRTD